VSLNTEEELLLTPIATFAAIVIIMAARAKTRRLARLRRAQEAWASAQDRNGLTS
jgi:uncharacterized membrane protein YhhN